MTLFYRNISELLHGDFFRKQSTPVSCYFQSASAFLSIACELFLTGISHLVREIVVFLILFTNPFGLFLIFIQFVKTVR